VSSSNWPAVREQFGRLRILTPSDEVTAVDVRARELGAAPARRQRIARVVLAALLVVLAGALALGCASAVTISARRRSGAARARPFDLVTSRVAVTRLTWQLRKSAAPGGNRSRGTFSSCQFQQIGTDSHLVELDSV